MAMASLLVGTASCIKDDASLTSECDRGPANVRLMVQNDATRSIGSSDTDNEVRQLRIYAFRADEKVGYAYVENVPQGMAYVPMSLSESGNIRFYVLANDGFATGANVGGIRLGIVDPPAAERFAVYKLAGSRRRVHFADG